VNDLECQTPTMCVPKSQTLGNRATWRASDRNTKTKLVELARGQHARMPSLRISEAEVWSLNFRAEGDGPPLAIRIRRLLKSALRAYGLRCVDFGLIAPPATHGVVTPAARATTAHDNHRNSDGFNDGTINSCIQDLIDTPIIASAPDLIDTDHRNRVDDCAVRRGDRQ
jgi:hypothetical protein